MKLLYGKELTLINILGKQARMSTSLVVLVLERWVWSGRTFDSDNIVVGLILGYWFVWLFLVWLQHWLWLIFQSDNLHNLFSQFHCVCNSISTCIASMFYVCKTSIKFWGSIQDLEFLLQVVDVVCHDLKLMWRHLSISTKTSHPQSTETKEMSKDK